MEKPLDAMSEISDEALLVLYANGDRMASRALSSRLVPRVLALASRLLGDPAEAEDIAQEAMLRLWKVAPDWRQGEAKVMTWLYRVASNLCTDRLRKRRGVGLDEINEPKDDMPNVDDQMIAKDRAAALQTTLGELPERQRQAVVLRHIEGLANPEIAEIMDLSVEAVESLVARGKRALAQQLIGQKSKLGLDG